jgi:hypothetical protein
MTSVTQFLYSNTNKWKVNNTNEDIYINNIKKLNMNSNLQDLINSPPVIYNTDKNTIFYHQGMTSFYKLLNLEKDTNIVYDTLVKEKGQGFFNFNVCKTLPILSSQEFKQWRIDNNIN